MTNPLLERAIRRGLERWAPQGTFRASVIDVSFGETLGAYEAEAEALGDALLVALVDAIQNTRFGPAFCSGLRGAPQAAEAFRSQLAGALGPRFVEKLEAFRNRIARDPTLKSRLGPFLVACRWLADGESRAAHTLLDQLCRQLAG